jgi:pSer/pThr/pTyr-binding forkhead associated (FHA) protein
MAGAKVPLSFKIYKGDQLIREEKLSLSVIKLGKVPSAHLKLDDETVSRMHAIIEVNGPNDVSIIDLGSTKGTFVNGQKVNKAKLQSGDTIVVGETRIELQIGGADEVGDEETKVNAPAPQDIIASTPRPAAPPPPAMAAAPRAPAPPAPSAAVTTSVPTSTTRSRRVRPRRSPHARPCPVRCSCRRRVARRRPIRRSRSRARRGRSSS